MTKQINKKNIIYIILACVLVIAIIIGIIFAYNKNKENKKVDEKAETKIEQLAEQATVELPKDYKGEVEIIEQEIKDEKTGEKKTVIKTVPKGTKIKGAKVIGTTTTEKIKETTTKAPTTKAPTQKPTDNTTNKPTQKPTQKPTTKPNTTVPTTKRKYMVRTWTYSETKAYIKSKGGQWDDSLNLTNASWITTDERTQEQMNESVDYLLSGAEGNVTKMRFIVVDENNWKQYDKDFGGYNPITNLDRERFQDDSLEGYWLIISLYE